jgi:hypothetical protein
MPDEPLEQSEGEIAGDAVCWIAHLCDECGAMNEAPGPCWNCGAVREKE